MTSNRVVYTAIAGGVDQLRPPPAPAEDWMYVCFSEDDPCCAPWQWRVLPASDLPPARQARDVKINAHRYLPEARISLWMDGNIEHTTDLNELVEQALADADIALHRHPQRTCLYREAVAVLDLGKDTAETVLPQVLRYARAGVPADLGLYATGVLLRRHCESITGLQVAWWEEIRRGSHRDQICLPVALAATDTTPAIISGDIWKGPLFRHRPHDGPAAQGMSGRG